ncbi:C-type lectin domain family 4 member M-like [Salvelinus alpinus]|uniref:C-type lectin domain family 4 member M-like n=1 Tax=Salvelinus alpinus TaxID=8036 RepID=UPI0039FC2204
MPKVIYTEPDMNKKVKFDRGEMDERIVVIYVSADTPRDGETSTKREETADTAPNNGPGDQHSAFTPTQTRYNNLTKERDQLQTRYNNLTKERDQLQTSYNNLTKERDQLQTRYNNLTKERDQLQTSYINLTEERDQLQTSYNNLTKEKGNIQSSIVRRDGDTLTPVCTSSLLRRTWEESRQDCLERGADLVIINSRDEQTLLFSLHLTAWIGLTDSVTEGTWKWVDGTSLATGYWGAGQPNNSGLFYGQEDCVEIYYEQDDPVKTWNDDKCGTNHNWICEKAMYWYAKQPDNAGPTGDEDCAEIHEDQSPLKSWNDMSCDSKLNWICEKVF